MRDVLCFLYDRYPFFQHFLIIPLFVATVVLCSYKTKKNAVGKVSFDYINMIAHYNTINTTVCRLYTMKIDAKCGGGGINPMQPKKKKACTGLRIEKYI